MGANRKQGWCLFVFLLGFTFLPAGLAYLGPLFSILGLLCLAGSLVGFYTIRPLEFGPADEQHGTAEESAKVRATRAA